MLNNCTTCSIYTTDNEYICDAEVTEVKENQASLVFSADNSDELKTEVNIVFYDGVLGLVSYSCTLISYKVDLDPAVYDHYKAIYHLGTLLTIIQRRNDIKVKTNFTAKLTITDEENKETTFDVVVKDISASGMLFISKESFLLNQEFSFLFEKGNTSFPVFGQILRTQEVSQNDYTGYGCRFIGLSSGRESIIREFVFREQIRMKL